MKTLEEVITVMNHVEFCCTNCKLQFDCDEVECFLEDALHYLKAYRDDKDDQTALRAYWAEQQANPALTWEQLKQMEGKPVWVEQMESEEVYGKWLLMQSPAVFGDVYMVSRYRERILLYEKEMGTVWNAYRKERS